MPNPQSCRPFVSRQPDRRVNRKNRKSALFTILIEPAEEYITPTTPRQKPNSRAGRETTRLSPERSRSWWDDRIRKDKIQTRISQVVGDDGVELDGIEPVETTQASFLT